MKSTLLFITLFLLSFPSHAQQERMESIRTRLDQLAVRDTAFLANVDFAVGHIPLGELVRNIAKIHRVNISVRNDNNLTVNCNLSRTRIIDLLAFFCQEYNLDLDVVGNIVSLYPHITPPPLPPEPKITYHADSMLLSYDLIQVPLSDAARRISAASGVNIIIPPQLYNKQVSGYVVSMPVETAIATLAAANELDSYKNEKGITTFSPKTQSGNGEPAPFTRRRDFAKNQLDIDSTGLISIQIEKVNVYDVIGSLFDKLGLNYYFISPVNVQASLYLKEVGLNTLLKVLFTGTAYTWYEEEGIYMFGTAAESSLYTTKIIPLQYRTVSRLLDAIPSNLKNNVQVHVFPDLNSIIASGDQRQVARVEQFIRSIDKTVPLIMIDVIIVDASKSIIKEAGLSLGLGTDTYTNSGTLSPGVDMNLNTSGINKLINSFNGFGSTNIGKVTSNFYVNLKLLEENGTINIQSTPKLSALNGQETVLKSGETMYYKEISQNIIGSQNPIQTSSYTWKSVDANLTIKIVPLVSGNDEITLHVEIEQGEFMPRKDEETPPGTSVRSFVSEIRVQSEDMILFGGIERSEKTKATSGLPFISRIPVLKWIFGKTKDNNISKKLNVFIKPTVIH